MTGVDDAGEGDDLDRPSERSEGPPLRPLWARCSLSSMSDAAHRDDEAPHGTSLLPRDLNEAELAAAPVLVSSDALLIDDLSIDEDELFLAATGC